MGVYFQPLEGQKKLIPNRMNAPGADWDGIFVAKTKSG